MDWTWVINGHQGQIVAPGRQPIVLLLIGLLGGFVFIRTSARLIRAQVRWWPGNVSAGGVHLHHEFFGVLVMLVAGALSFTVSALTPWREGLALLFGIGAGLVLDEFALLLHLQDVYWSEEGRTSVDAVIVAVLFTGMLLVGVMPFGLEGVSGAESSARWTAVAVVACNLSFALIAALKGKLWLALLSVAVPPVGLVAAVRLAAPTSPWARRRYRRRPDLITRAERRSARWDRRKRRLITVIGGAPTASGEVPVNPAPK